MDSIYDKVNALELARRRHKSLIYLARAIAAVKDDSPFTLTDEEVLAIWGLRRASSDEKRRAS